jgi:hypothetical protein
VANVLIVAASPLHWYERPWIGRYLSATDRPWRNSSFNGVARGRVDTALQHEGSVADPRAGECAMLRFTQHAESGALRGTAFEVGTQRSRQAWGGAQPCRGAGGADRIVRLAPGELMRAGILAVRGRPSMGTSTIGRHDGNVVLSMPLDRTGCPDEVAAAPPVPRCQ